MNTARTCRDRGWTAGTHLVGDEGYGPTIIRITAVGESHILARAIFQNGKEINRRENLWTLAYRDWLPVKPEDLP